MTKEVMNYFREMYAHSYDADYPVAWGRDMAILKRLLKTYTPEQLMNYIQGYFRLNDNYVQEAGHPLPLLPIKIPAIQAMLMKEANERVGKSAKLDAEQIAAVADKLETDGDF